MFVKKMISRRRVFMISRALVEAVVEGDDAPEGDGRQSAFARQPAFRRPPLGRVLRPAAR